MRCFCLLLLLTAALWGQGTTVKAKPEEYPVQAFLEKADLAAEYMIHSVMWENESVLAEDFLVVEVAVYPGNKQALDVQPGHFTMKVNGKEIRPASVGMVAASIKYPDWSGRPRGQAIGGLGPVIVGRQPDTARFPGDPTARYPTPSPRTPSPEEQNGVPQQPRMSTEEILTRASLPEREATRPVSGYLYFPHRGKVRTVDLLYHGPAGAGTLKLK